MTSTDRSSGAVGRPRLLYIVSEDWYFLSHRLPMARAARSAGFEVHVATRVGDGADALAREGFHLHPIPFVRGRLSPLASLSTIRALRRVHRDVVPDLVHRVALQPTLLDGIATIGRPVHAVDAVTGFGYAAASSTPKARLLRFVIGALLRWMVKRGRDVVLVQNADDADALSALGLRSDRIVLIAGSGVDVERLVPAPEPAGAITVAFAGRLINSKGVRTLMDAHRLLRARAPDVHLMIAGAPDSANPDSVTPDEIMAWSREPRVTWLGHVDDIVGFWTRAHIAVLASRGGEGVPKSLLEAAACGRPLIATDVPGCRDIVVDGVTGLLVMRDDPAELAAAICRLAATPDLRARLGAAARQRVVERFSSAAVGRATVELYARLSPGAANAIQAAAPHRSVPPPVQGAEIRERDGHTI